MDVLRQWFLQYMAQTSDFPVGLEIEKAEGIYLFDSKGNTYIDLISGISVNSLGHSHPKIINAVKEQVQKYMHVMVYGEYVQAPQANYARQLLDMLPAQFNNIYFVNSGSEAVETALKLSKRVTCRSEIIAFHNAYHGSTHGALSVMGNEECKKPFRPLLPDIRFLRFNSFSDLQYITRDTACIIIEPVQGEAGVIIPSRDFLVQLRKKCDETKTLLIFDEIQTGFGRTGKLFAFQKYNVYPDIFVIAKAMGGGMPIGGVVSSKKLLDAFKDEPISGHITTFGGHPVSCAAASAVLSILEEENILSEVEEKSSRFKSLLTHEKIKEVRGEGLLLACQLFTHDQTKKVIHECIRNGLVVDWFLFCDTAIRIAPPLIITNEQIEEACFILLKAIGKISV